MAPSGQVRDSNGGRGLILGDLVDAEQALVQRLSEVGHHHQAVDADLVGDHVQASGTLLEELLIAHVQRRLA